MDKSTKQIESFAEDLMSSWMKAWPEYYQHHQDDHPAIIAMAEKCAGYLKVSLEEKEGYDRCMKALYNISVFCKFNNPWASKNIRYINYGFQRLYNEMAAAHRLAAHRTGK